MGREAVENMEAHLGLPLPRIDRRLGLERALSPPLPARRGTRRLDSLVWGPIEVGQYQNPIVVRRMACGHSPSAFAKLLPFCSRWLRLTVLNHQNGESCRGKLNSFTFKGVGSLVVLGKPEQLILNMACCNFYFF